MDYQGNIIRPPSEANSIILQVTTGCSHNHCTFCGAYREKPFGEKAWAIVEKDIDFAAQWCLRQHTLFLADGDALALPHASLVRLLQTIKQRLPWVRRVASYANCHNILARSEQQLQHYNALGLRRLYMGLETGDDQTLLEIGKGVDSQQMIEAGRRVAAAGVFLSVTCLLGIAGKTRSRAHAEATARVLNQMQPRQIAVLTLMLLPGTPLYKQWKQQRFMPLAPEELFVELETLLREIELAKVQFQANHASNYFSLSGRLPKDKEAMLATIAAVRGGNVPLKEERFRLL